MPDANITKRALAMSMKALMEEAPFAKISVGDICLRCGMNRKSFYYHFRDKYELVNWIYYTEFVGVMAQRDYTDTWDFFTDMCAYFHQNRAFYVNALRVEGQNSFREYFGEVFQPILMDAMEEIFTASEHKRFYAVFFTDALLVSIQRWLEEGTLPPEEYVFLLRTGIEGTVRRVLQRIAEREA